ncbi:MAG: hypothetical protein AAGC81_09675 [Pseudomonadota bacterium]
MEKTSREQRIVIWIFLLAVLFSFFILNRWIFTPLGAPSFGRVWHFYVSYSDFGFIRRGFVGTIFSITDLNKIFDDEYIFAYIVHHFAIILISVLVFNYVYKNNILDHIFIFGAFFSPAFLPHLGYNTGSLDVFLIVIIIVNIMYSRSLVQFCFLIAIGCMTHELFAFTIPAQILAFHFRGKTEGNFHIWLPAFVGLGVMAFLLLRGQISLPQDEVELILREKMPNAAGRHSLWSGYKELSLSLEQNFSHSIDLMSSITWIDLPIVILPLIYCFILVVRTVTLAPNHSNTMMLIFALTAPLFASVIASDFYRWISISCLLSILISIIFFRKGVKRESKIDLVIAFFCILAPFGTTGIDRPFPMHQFAIEQVISAR